MCGEYGEKLGRPHFHALLFGLDFKDKYKWAYREKNVVYRSPKLEKVWQFGHSEIGNVSYQSAAYVARYVMKKITGELAENHYQRLDTDTGEIIQLQPEYNAMSLKPGIAAEWFKQYKNDVYPSDEVIINTGKKNQPQTPPRYYDKLLEKESPGIHKLIKDQRREKAIKHKHENTPERLATKEKVAVHRLNKLKRQLT